MEHPYIYIVVRNDLPNPQKAVQSAHAAIEATREYLTDDDEHPSVIIVVVKDEKRLKRLTDELDIRFKKFYEPDIGNQMTAIATEPLFGEERNVFKRYQLLQ